MVTGFRCICHCHGNFFRECICVQWVADMKHEQFRAANRSKVDIDGTAHNHCLGRFFALVGTKIGYPDYKSAKLKCLVGGIKSQHHVYDDVV